MEQNIIIEICLPLEVYCFIVYLQISRRIKGNIKSQSQRIGEDYVFKRAPSTVFVLNITH